MLDDTFGVARPSHPGYEEPYWNHNDQVQSVADRCSKKHNQRTQSYHCIYFTAYNTKLHYKDYDL